MRGECTTPQSPTTVFLRKVLREYSARSCWSTAERCERWGALAALISSRQRLYMQNFEVWFFLLDKEPNSGSHSSSFLHILPLKQYNGWISMKSMRTKIIQIQICHIFKISGTMVFYIPLGTYNINFIISSFLFRSFLQFLKHYLIQRMHQEYW